MTKPAVEDERRTLPRLTSLRWFAAFFVFGYHASATVPWRPLRVFAQGQLGVTFFFVLSGFILAWSARPGGSVGDFYLRRFARVWPSMFVVFLGAALLSTIWMAAPVRTGLLGAVTSLLALQSWWPGSYPAYAYNAVAWSLAVEAFFYAVFPFLISSMRRVATRLLVINIVAMFLVGTGATALLSEAGYGATIAYFNPAVRLPQFVIGICVGLLIKRGHRPRLKLWVAISIVFAATGASRFIPLYPLENYVVALPFALLLATAAAADLSGQNGALTSRWLVYLGELSFCFYLVHLLVLQSLATALDWAGTSLSSLGGLARTLLAFVSSVVLAAAVHHFVERPAQVLIVRNVSTFSRSRAKPEPMTGRSDSAGPS